MKRIISSILIAFLCFIAIGCSTKSNDSNNNEYLFRNIPYGTHYNKAKEILVKGLEAEGITKELRETISENGIIINLFHNIEIAGHKAGELFCYFTNEDDEIIEGNLDKVVFNRGEYIFYNNNSEELNLIYNDLLDKLIKLYGEPTKRDNENKRIRWDSETEKTSIVLKGTERLNEITINYIYYYLNDDIDNTEKSNLENNYNGL